MPSGTEPPADWLAPLLASTETALVGIDLNGHTALWSSGAESLFGWPAGDVLGHEPPFIPAALRQEWQLEIQKVFESGRPTPVSETQRLTRDNQSITVLRTGTATRDATGRVNGLLDLLVDATALKQLDDEARALAQVRERELIAMDLHDGLIQSLYGVVLNLAARERTLDSGQDPAQNEARAAIRDSREVVERVIAETRGYLFSLRERSFTPRSFEAGLRLLVDSLRLNSGIEVRLDYDPAVERLLESEVRGHLLYLVREAISNVLRHASAARTTVEVSRLPEAVVVRVSDNGRGFTVSDAMRAAERHSGLHNMAERARLVGGRLEVVSGPGEGTRVSVELPI
jgi:PAS domain S-box-containing protein